MKVVIHLLSQGVCVVGFIGVTGDISDDSVQDRAVGVARSLGDIVGIVNNAAIVNKGNVINVTTSSTSQAPVPAFGPYGVTKVSLNYVSKAISVEYPEITCLAFYPGVVDTNMNQDAIDAKLAHPISADLPGRIIANLALRASHELTGQYYVYSDSAMAPYST
ncbi:hypothetical protein DL89DRAFT_297842 [Linderina pennispora]|uniref:NAD(P)-binding protein n=1 Tax=Linderina pennispora TaxID=61395 RepID=A0A1Y1VSM4_9FUNG|nr:uncharacterized protein DL89DRAFT_297842 [Linderina pennispora]ORX64025.1 hypothetical protein DL89DRAFT_297842 [Linderina pennispora]